MRLPQKPDRRAEAAYWLIDKGCVLIRHQRACFIMNTYSYRNHPIGRHWHRFFGWVIRASSDWTEWERVP